MIDKSAKILNGSCLCGTVRYEVADDFRYAMNCHCSLCRRATGAAFKPFGGIEISQFKISSGAAQLVRYGDGIDHDFHCGKCGSLIYSVVREAAYAHVTYGTLIDAPSLAPRAHIFVGSKAPWFTITDDLPQHLGFPD
ncbi:GFA family protein [Dongia sp.]|uniref:GFA family protein n=1 Tax=Dongia sp. TaxID=1977262 RepID=UPI0035B1085D